MLSKINVDSNIVTDLKEICDRYDELFVGIGPKLANKINAENKKAFSSHLTHINITSLSFTLADQKDIETHTPSLKTKTSFGIDVISTKCLKLLSPALTKPLSSIIN